MKSHGPVHAPKTGIGNSAGLKPPAIAKGVTAHPKNSDGKSVRRNPADPKSGPTMGNGGHAMLRKPY